MSRATVSNITQSAVALPLDTDERVEERLRILFRNKEAYSENTWKQMLSVIRCFARWCEARDKVWLPASPDDVADYLYHLKHDLNRTVNTVNQHHAQINNIHKHAGLARPSESMEVSLGMKRMRRTAVTSGERISQAIPLHVRDVFRLADFWDSSDRLADRRNLAFIGVAYNSLLRISEVARLRVQDIHFQPDGSATLNVGYTKTIVDQYGVVKKLSEEVAGWLKEWIELANLADTPDALVFCKVGRYNHAQQIAEPLARVNIEKIFAAAWFTANGISKGTKRYRTWTGHSARVGAAQDMAEHGKTLPQIMHEGTWKRPEQVLNYIRNIDAEKSVMLDIVKGGKRDK